MGYRFLFIGVCAFFLFFTACQKGDSFSASTPAPSPIAKDDKSALPSDDPDAKWMLDTRIRLCGESIEDVERDLSLVASGIKAAFGYVTEYNLTTQAQQKIHDLKQLLKNEKASAEEKLNGCKGIKDKTHQLAAVRTSLVQAAGYTTESLKVDSSIRRIEKAFSISTVADSYELTVEIWHFRFGYNQIQQRNVLSVDCVEKNSETGTAEHVSEFSDNMGVEKKYLPSCHLKGIGVNMTVPSDELYSSPDGLLSMTDYDAESRTTSRDYVYSSADPKYFNVQKYISSQFMSVENRDFDESQLVGRPEKCIWTRRAEISRIADRTYTLKEIRSCDDAKSAKALYSIYREIKFENRPSRK